MNNLGKSTSDYTISRSDFFAIIEIKQRPAGPRRHREGSSFLRVESLKQLTELLFSRNNWNTDPNPGTSEVEGRGVLRAINFDSPKQSICGNKVANFSGCFKQCSGSMTFWCGSGSADPCLGLMDPHSDSDPDPDHAISSLTFKRPTKNIFLYSFSAYYFLKLHLHHFSKIKCPKEVTKQ